MSFIIDKITEWLSGILIGGIMNSLVNMFGNVNQRVGEIAGQVGLTPQAWNGGIYNMIRSLSQNVILPIAGVILAIVMTMELIQMVMEKNNMHEFDTWIFFKWIFKTFVAVMLVTNTWNIVMAVFDMAQSIVSSASGVIITDTEINIEQAIVNLEARLNEMEIGELMLLWFQSIFVGFTMNALQVVIFVIIYGRMIEIYLVTAVAPVPIATMTNREAGQMGQNYLRSLFALGFQAFLIIVCVGIYAVLVQTIAIDVDAELNAAVWTCVGYTVLLCYTLFKTSGMAKSIFNAH